MRAFEPAVRKYSLVNYYCNVQPAGQQQIMSPRNLVSDLFQPPSSRHEAPGPVTHSQSLASVSVLAPSQFL